MIKINLSPDAGSGGQAAPAKRAKKAAPGERPASKEKPETRGEQIIHELFRLAKVDLRSSAHGKGLAAELASLIGGK